MSRHNPTATGIKCGPRILNKRIAVIGNGGGGKTTLSKQLARYYGVPVFHVDSIQYQAGWLHTPEHECNDRLNQIADSESWLIDGFGGKSAIKRRLELADTVVFIDLPLVLHYFWALKRQLGSWRGSRNELPAGCVEFSLAFTGKLIKVLWEVNRDYVPWFRQLVAELPASTTLFHLRTRQQVNQFLKEYKLHCPNTIA